MDTGFFGNPIWRKFSNRPIWVLSLSDTEHRLRDARALIALRDFLPPAWSGQTTYATVTLDENSRPITPWPRIPSDAGVVVLGRPSLFGPELEHQIETSWTPALGFSMGSENARDDGYRAIEASGTGQRFLCPRFAAQREAGGKELFDYGLLYSGWSENRPTVLLAGTSTVGTWGCVHYALRNPGPMDIRWQEEVQGVVRASVDNTAECFQDVRAEPVRMLAPCRIWMEGKDLPALSDWRVPSRLRMDEKRNAGKFDLRILVNDRAIFQKSRTHVPALVLLALAGARGGRRSAGGMVEARTDVPSVMRGMFDFLYSSTARKTEGISYEDFVREHRTHVMGTLKELVKQVRESGGIASVDPARGEYCICLRPIPPFLPALG